MGNAAALERGAQPLHIDTVGDAEPAAGVATVNIGLNGIGDDHVRMFVRDDPDIGTIQFRIPDRIHPPPFQRRVDHLAAHGPEIVDMLAKGNADDYPPAPFLQRRDQLPPKLPQHKGMVCENQNPLVHFDGS